MGWVAEDLVVEGAKGAAKVAEATRVVAAEPVVLLLERLAGSWAEAGSEMAGSAAVETGEVGSVARLGVDSAEPACSRSALQLRSRRRWRT